MAGGGGSHASWTTGTCPSSTSARTGIGTYAAASRARTCRRPSPTEPGPRRSFRPYDGDSTIRSYLRRRGIKAAIPERIDQINGRIRRGEGLCRLDRTAYRRRNVVERCFNKLKHNKALATRYDKRARHYKALVTLACLRLWLR
ncbi:transposase [Streptomyces canus]|uniref:transposase n=1 Tax=Streptomyces canus TaxID=58343 RepID=UPI00340474A7